ncbi:MAG: LLM class flavin-dependent oxidoreductase [Chloroflexi bacterium]|nr:LLM class flavin-dependent oxidoreductase [Chloroflexota bacterium]
MQVGLGIDQSLGLTFAARREVAREAALLGYESLWSNHATNPGPAVNPLFVCTEWQRASAEIVPGGLTTGIAIVPVPLWTPVTLAAAASTVAELTGDRFILGVGSSHIHSAAYRERYGVPGQPPIRMMREWLGTLRQLIAGERVDRQGTLSLRGVRLQTQPRHVPIFLGALGRQMLRLSGEVADGVILNWSTSSHVAEARERLNEGAHSAGRDPSVIRIADYIHVCVDEDEDVARRAYVRALGGYALARPGASRDLGYPAHFARPGFSRELDDLEALRASGASDAEIVEAFPRGLARLVGYYGPAEHAAEAFRNLAVGMDLPIVRVIPTRPGPEALRAAIQACRPNLVR